MTELDNFSCEPTDEMEDEARQQNTGQNFTLFSELTSTILICRAVILLVDT